MRLEVKIERLKEERIKLLESLNEFDIKINKYENLKTITIPVMVKEIGEIKELKNSETDGFEIKVYKGDYEFILGGDGRSKPWSEQRKGIICDVESIYYLTDVHKDLVTQYLKSLGNIDRINFIF